MRALHLLWSSHERFSLFGEDAALAAERRSATAGGPHPFACSCAALAEELSALAPFGFDDGVERSLKLLLPSTGGGPLASPSLRCAAIEPPGGRIGLRPYRVPALELGRRSALSLLLGLRATERASDSLRFFAELAKLALELVARARVVPAIVEREARFLARWRPALGAPAEATRVALLAEALPPLCRAELPASSSPRFGRRRAERPAPPEPRALVEAALAELVDVAAREALELRDHRSRRRGRPPRALARRFGDALASEEGTIRGETGELSSLAEFLEAWASTAFASGEVRTCFRLEAPAAEDEDAEQWRLELLLQSLEDRSLLVPAREVWQADEGALLLGRLSVESPEERLLGDLGRALRLYPALARALEAPAPTELELDAAGALGFLREAAPLLEQAGFGVLVPSWWGQPAARLGARLSLAPRGDAGDGLLGLDALCAFEWQIAIGDEPLSAAELRRLARLKVPLVRRRGQWVELRREDLEAALALVGRRERGEMSLREALRLASGQQGGEDAPLPVRLEARGALRGLLGENEGDRRIESVAAPASFRGTLRPYQERGLSWLAFLARLGLGGCLADDMGLGKTIQLLALLLAERDHDRSCVRRGPAHNRRARGRAGERAARSPGPTLLVCPMSVVGNWQREAARFAPTLSILVHHGAGRLEGRRFARAAAASDLVITTYALAARDRGSLASLRWWRVALDEAQNVKNSATRQAQAVRALETTQRVALTGTPIENRLSELWSVMEFLNPGLLGSAAEFQRRFAVPVERYRDEASATRLRRLTTPFVLRRLKTDRSIITDLPEKLEMRVYCNLTREQASLYQAVALEMLTRVAESRGIGRRGLVLATLTRLKQVCNHPAQLLADRSPLEGRSGKLARLEELLEEALAAGDKALCFTQYAELGHLLRPHLEQRLGCEVLYLHGGVARRARDALVARFQDPAGPPLLLLSLKAGGTGLNLTAASQVVHFDRWWNPGVEDQATDRAYRIGQTRRVQVRKLVCLGTLEEKIDAMIERKKELAERVVGSGEAWLTELSTAELRELVALGADAVGEA